MRPPEAALLERALAAGGAIAGRLRASLERMAPLAPLTPEALAALGPDEAETVDAFLKRFEQLEDLLARQVFKAIGILEGEDDGGLSARDRADLMEKLGLLDAARWREIHLTRNRLAHGYPLDPERQCAVVNEVHRLAPELLAVLGAAERHVERRRLLD